MKSKTLVSISKIVASNENILIDKLLKVIDYKVGERVVARKVLGLEKTYEVFKQVPGEKIYRLNYDNISGKIYNISIASYTVPDNEDYIF